jgi:hypothetical protein
MDVLFVEILSTLGSSLGFGGGLGSSLGCGRATEATEILCGPQKPSLLGCKFFTTIWVKVTSTLPTFNELIPTNDEHVGFTTMQKSCTHCSSVMAAAGITWSGLVIRSSNTGVVVTGAVAAVVDVSVKSTADASSSSSINSAVGVDAVATSPSKRGATSDAFCGPSVGLEAVL